MQVTHVESRRGRPAGSQAGGVGKKRACLRNCLTSKEVQGVRHGTQPFVRAIQPPDCKKSCTFAF